MWLLHALAVFLIMTVVDFAWSAYVKELADRRILRAACWSAAIVLLGAFTAIEYVKDHLLVIPAAMGAFAGTWASSLLDRKKEQPK